MRSRVRSAVIGAVLSVIVFAGSGCDFGNGTPVSNAFEGAKTDPTQLRAFLSAFPKGADLHNQLAGAVYAEDLISIATDTGDCFDPRIQSLTPAPCVPPEREVSLARTDRDFRDEMIDAFSLRHFVASPDPAIDSRYSQYYASFNRFARATTDATLGRQLVAAKAVAARDNVDYVEFFVSPRSTQAAALATTIARQPRLPRRYRALVRRGLATIARQARVIVTRAAQQSNRIDRCATQQPADGCRVQSTYVYAVNREQPADTVFAQLALGFTLARTDQRFVGVSLTGPENGPIALRDNSLHMTMIRQLNALGAPVETSIDAGALTEGFVAPTVLGTHIQAAIAADASRIGHGTDLAFVSNPDAVMRELRESARTVEILLSTDDEVLGVGSDDHPLPTYLANDVPVVLGSGSEGVTRTDLTAQYQLAVERYNLSYGEILKLSRLSLEMSFLPGASLWTDGVGSTIAGGCSSEIVKSPQSTTATPGEATQPSSGSVGSECLTFLVANPKAAAQLSLERRLARFAESAPKRHTLRAPTESVSRGS